MPVKSGVNNARGEKKGVPFEGEGGQSWDTIRVARKGQRNREAKNGHSLVSRNFRRGFNIMRG